MGRTGRPSPLLLRDPACGLSRRSRGPPRRGSGARAQQPCAVHAHDHPRASPATIAVAVDGYRTRWIVTGGPPRGCSAPRLDPRRSLVAFRGSGSRVVSRITIERFRLSSQARASRATIASCPAPASPANRQSRSTSGDRRHLPLAQAERHCSDCAPGLVVEIVPSGSEDPRDRIHEGPAAPPRSRTIIAHCWLRR